MVVSDDYLVLENERNIVQRIIQAKVIVLETPADFTWSDAAPNKWFRVHKTIGMAAMRGERKVLLHPCGMMSLSGRARVERINPASLPPFIVAAIKKEARGLNNPEKVHRRSANGNGTLT